MNRCLQGLKLEVDYAILDKWDERNERGRNKTRGKMEKIDADWSMWETFPNRHVHVVCVTVLLKTEQREEKQDVLLSRRVTVTLSFLRSTISRGSFFSWFAWNSFPSQLFGPEISRNTARCKAKWNRKNTQCVM